MLHVCLGRRATGRTIAACASTAALLRNGSSFDFDPEAVSHWSQWLGHQRPRLLVVGWDFSGADYFVRNRGMDDPSSPTNLGLRDLLAEAGPPPAKNPAAAVYLTNSVLCPKLRGMSGLIRTGWSITRFASDPTSVGSAAGSSGAPAPAANWQATACHLDRSRRCLPGYPSLVRSNGRMHDGADRSVGSRCAIAQSDGSSGADCGYRAQYHVTKRHLRFRIQHLRFRIHWSPSLE